MKSVCFFCIQRERKKKKTFIYLFNCDSFSFKTLRNCSSYFSHLLGWVNSLGHLNLTSIIRNAYLNIWFLMRYDILKY